MLQERDSKLLEWCPWVRKKGWDLVIRQRLALGKNTGSSSIVTERKAGYMDRVQVGSKCVLVKVLFQSLVYSQWNKEQNYPLRVSPEDELLRVPSRNETIQHSYLRGYEKLYPEVNLPSGDGPSVSKIFHSESTPRWSPLALPFSILSIDLSLP